MIADFKPYSAMKDSGTEWLGKVPEHWEVQRLKTLLAAPITDGPHSTPDFLFDGIPFLSVDGIQDGELVFENCRFVSAKDHDEFCRKSAPRRGDILLGKAASTGKIAQVKVDFEFSIWSPLALIRPNQSLVSSTFLEHAFKDVFVQAQIETLCTLNTQKNISMGDIPRLLVPLPPLPEQAAIVRYLDYVDRRIRKVVRAKQQLITLFEEQKQALIHRAVTRGLDPDVPLKDSGVVWLGEVPEHWEVQRLRNVAELRVSNVDKIVKEGEAAVRLCNYVDVYKNDRISEQMDFMMATATPKEIERFRLEEGDVLITKDSEAWDDIGVPALVTDPASDLISGYHLAIFRSNTDELVGGYLFRALQSKGLAYQFHVEAKGVTRYGLSQSGIKSVWMPLPPLPEQAAIVEHIDQATSDIDTVIERARREIDLLNEYRTRLIADVVTGKCDVREAAAALPEVDPLDTEGDVDDALDSDAEAVFDELDAIPEEAPA